jgi:hypothetical protein
MSDDFPGRMRPRSDPTIFSAPTIGFRPRIEWRQLMGNDMGRGEGLIQYLTLEEEI